VSSSRHGLLRGGGVLLRHVHDYLGDLVGIAALVDQHVRQLLQRVAHALHLLGLVLLGLLLLLQLLPRIVALRLDLVKVLDLVLLVDLLLQLLGALVLLLLLPVLVRLARVEELVVRIDLGRGNLELAVGLLGLLALARRLGSGRGLGSGLGSGLAAPLGRVFWWRVFWSGVCLLL
jgi:hypothetical protein